MTLPAISHRRPLFPALGTFLLLLLSLGLAGCSGDPPMLTPTVTAPTPTETQTIQWFPATVTATFFTLIIPSPTLEPLPGVGDLLFTDEFNDASLWNTATSTTAGAQVENDRLTLSLASSPLTILSLRSEPVLGDFYAEVTASTSLCQGNDQYGILFRASPGGSYYRFVLACNGSIRLERVLEGTTDILQNWVPTGDVPVGAPADVHIGVWISGAEMRLFLNDHLQFTQRDPVLLAGTLGFFARAGGTTPLRVSFSGLKVYSVAYITPTPSPTASSTPTP